MPTVSIIMATYNRSEVLRLAIRSVIAQTYADWELIVVGDACADDTAEVVAAVGDPRVRFFNRTTNFGEQSGPNNDGLSLSSGRLIAYLNHDDLWFPDHLESLMTFLSDSRADLAYSLPLSIDRNGLAYCGLTNEEARYDPTFFVPASLWLARRSLIEELQGWRPAWQIDARAPSQDLLFRAWSRGRRLLCMKKFTALVLASGGRAGCYRTHDDSQHRALFEKLSQPGFRESLATSIAERLTRSHEHLANVMDGRSWFDRICDRVLTRLGRNPDATRNRLARRRRGWWINYLRQFRGLQPIEARRDS